MSEQLEPNLNEQDEIINKFISYEFIPKYFKTSNNLDIEVNIKVIYWKLN